MDAAIPETRPVTGLRAPSLYLRTAISWNKSGARNLPIACSAHMIPERIILVYNADNGLFNALNDWAHKLFSPATHQCTLCRFTYGLSGMLMPWKRFIESLECPAEFLHRPEFRDRYPQMQIQFPAVLARTGGHLQVLLSAEEILQAGDLEGLMQALRRRLDDLSAQEPVSLLRSSGHNPSAVDQLGRER